MNLIVPILLEIMKENEQEGQRGEPLLAVNDELTTFFIADDNRA